jgi:osomolarity two-component system response regulator SSK1
MEWGCMQALIDFDGWRKWKDMAAAAEKQQATLQANEDPATRAKREAKEAKKAAMMAKMAQRA